MRLYRNTLKIWDFGKEDPQNFCSERATIAERQGASENENYEANPTQPKTNFSMCFGIRILLWLCPFLALVLAACGQNDGPSVRGWMENDGKVKVLSTTAFIDDLVGRVGQDRIRHLALIQGDLDPHSYELVKGDDEKFIRSHVVFSNGLGLEHGASLRYQIQRHPDHVSLGDLIYKKKPEAIILRQGQFDPHIWMDVSLWADAVDPIVETLSRLDPSNAAFFAENGAALKEEMARTHADLKRSLSQIPNEKRFLVTSHDAFNYFARGYLSEGENDPAPRFKAPEGLAPDGQLSSQDIQMIIGHLCRYRVGVVFPESNVSKDSLKKIASACKEKGLDVKIASSSLHADALGTKGSDAGDYLQMMRRNGQVLVDEWK